MTTVDISIGNMINLETYPNSGNCSGKAQTASEPKDSMCSKPDVYGYAYGYAYFKCFNL